MTDLVQLYQQMSDHTAPECGQCLVPYSCCSPEYCDMATERAKEFGVSLTNGNHATLPYMVEGVGCTVPPYLRVLCTLHTCAINSIGFKKGDRNWTRRYFALRAHIERAECRRLRGAHGLSFPPE